MWEEITLFRKEHSLRSMNIYPAMPYTENKQKIIPKANCS